jgi:hypothetical protein
MSEEAAAPPSDSRCTFSLPVYFYDGQRVTPATHDIVRTIHRKLMCIDTEVDYFMDTILEIVRTIHDNGGFQCARPTTYRFHLRTESIEVRDPRLASVSSLPCETYHVLLWRGGAPTQETK